MSYCSTTFDRIVDLYDEAGRLLAHEYLTEAEQARFREIRVTLDRLWTHRRAELVFSIHGPPRSLGGGTEADQRRQFAHGIAPLPGGA